MITSCQAGFSVRLSYFWLSLCLFALLVSSCLLMTNFMPNKVLTIASVKPQLKSERLKELVWEMVKQGMAVRHIDMNETYAESCRNIELLENNKRPMDFIIVYLQYNETQQEKRVEQSCPELDDATNFATVFEDMLQGKITYVYNANKRLDTKSYEELAERVTRDRKNEFESNIPKVYPHKADEEKNAQRRLFLAIIALMAMVIFGLVAVLFFTSLQRHKQQKKGAIINRGKPTQELGLKTVDVTTAATEDSGRCPRPPLQEATHSPAVNNSIKAEGGSAETGSKDKGSAEMEGKANERKEGKEQTNKAAK